MKAIAIIPARYSSTRFPGKPLALLGGKPIIERVYERVAQVIEDVYVATDDQRIFDAVETFRGNVVMTSTAHKSGTDRCCEAFNKIAKNCRCRYKHPRRRAIYCCIPTAGHSAMFDDPSADIATLVQPFQDNDSFVALADPNSPKVVLDNHNFCFIL